MFKTKTDRLNYGSILTPPIGYTLSAAVGTTYSLDLETLTAACITLGLQEETDSELIHSPICMLHALQKVTNKILIFCETGQTKIPSVSSSLHLLLEKMIVPVALNYNHKLKSFPSFHPKTWTLAYINENNEKLYRFIVLSRNLTFDRSWDITVTIDGTEAPGDKKHTEPIIEFLNYLKSHIRNDSTGKTKKRELINSLAKSLENVYFKTDNKVFSDFQILPLGIGSNGYNMNNDPLLIDTFHELVVMSPFLSGSVIQDFNDKNDLKECKRTLITRRSELSKIANKAHKFKIYVMKDEIVDGEYALSEENASKQLQDIHAKLYIRRKYLDTDLYIGSMNASKAALNFNVEMMLKLYTKNKYLNTDLFLRELFGEDPNGKDNPFLSIDHSTIESIAKNTTNEKAQLERIIKEICRMNGKAYVTPNKEKFDIEINFQLKSDKIYDNVTISPFRCGMKSTIIPLIKFQNLDLSQLSEIYQITAKGIDEEVNRIIFIPTQGIPKERECEIVKNIVKDKRSFIEYVAFALGSDYLQTMLEEKNINESGIFRNRKDTIPALYEKMLKTAAENPKKLTEINYLMSMINDETIISPDFRKMYEVFKNTLKLQ